MTWAAAAANAAIAVAYMAICVAIARPLVRAGQFPSNRLATATAAIFFSCSVGHALHAGVFLAGTEVAVGSSHALHEGVTGWATAQFAWDGLTALIGTYYWTLRSSYRGLLDGGQLFDDLRERQRRELAEATRDSERRYRGVFEQALAGMAIMDTDGRIVRVNAALRHLLGGDEFALIGAALTDLLHPDDAEREGARFADVLAGREAGLQVECRLARADGSLIPTALSLSLVRDEDGGPEQVVAQLVDLTAVAEGQRAMREREEQFRSVFDSALVGMVLTAPDGRLLRVNQALCDMLGYTSEELHAAHWPSITHPDDLHGSRELSRRALAGELSGFNLEKRYLRKDGGVVTVSMSSALVRDADGRPLYFATQMADISARRDLETRLRDQRDQYERLLEGLSELGEGVVVEDQGRIVYANDAISRLTGYARDELRDMDAVSALIVHTATDEVLEHGGSTGTLTLRRRDGELVPADYASIPFTMDGTDRRLAVMRDVSERQRWTMRLADHAEQLAGANAELRAASQLKTDLLAMLSHDIGQPLTAIRGYAQMLVHKWADTSDEQRLMMLDRVRASAERLGDMVHQILEMGRAETQGMVAERSRVPLRTALEQALAPLADSFPGLVLHPLPDVPVLVDPGHLQQMVTNLASNAGKYGRPPIEVGADVRVDGWVEVRIRDHGSGIPAAFVPRLFDRYTRADARQARGTGLGLFIVRRLAEANGGSIAYDPDGAPGACFVLRLEAAEAAMATTVLPEEHLTG